MDEWEENLYDYGGDDFVDNYEDNEDRIYDEENFNREPDDEEDPFRGDLVEEDIDFRPDFKQMQQMTGDKGRGTTIAPGANKRTQKAMRSAEDVIIDQLRGVLSSDAYSGLSESKKNSLVGEAELFKNVHLLNLETLIQALIWKMEAKQLNKKSFADFVKKYSVADQISLLLYIRLSSTKSK